LNSWQPERREKTKSRSKWEREGKGEAEMERERVHKDDPGIKHTLQSHAPRDPPFPAKPHFLKFPTSNVPQAGAQTFNL
jgi:hypothetical protein